MKSLKDLRDGTVYTVYETYTTPPVSGMGVLSGDVLSMRTLWYSLILLEDKEYAKARVLRGFEDSTEPMTQGRFDWLKEEAPEVM